jgi:hypothetical protein
VELLEIVDSLVHVDEGGKSKRGEITNSDLVGGRVLDDLGTQVGRLDGTQMLLVRLGVGGILVKHVWGTSLGLSLEDGKPKLLSLDGLFTLAGLFVTLVQPLKLFRVDIGESRALGRTHESPVAIGFDSLHEQVGNPKTVKQVSSSNFFLSVILS